MKKIYTNYEDLIKNPKKVLLENKIKNYAINILYFTLFFLLVVLSFVSVFMFLIIPCNIIAITLYLGFIILLVFLCSRYFFDWVYLLILKMFENLVAFIYKDDYQKIKQIVNAINKVENPFQELINQIYEEDIFDKNGNLLRNYVIDDNCSYEVNNFMGNFTKATIHCRRYKYDVNNFKIPLKPNFYLEVDNNIVSTKENIYTFDKSHNKYKSDCIWNKQREVDEYVITNVEYNPEFYDYDEVNNKLIKKKNY